MAPSSGCKRVWGLLGLMAALVAGLMAPPPAGAMAPHAAPVSATLAVVPFPGTPDASPASQVIFSALRPAALRNVSVSGTRSGSHAGRLVALPGELGTAFVPVHGFVSGETVTVRARLRSPADGTASGDPGSTELRFSFGVARPLAERTHPVPRAVQSHFFPWQTYRSEPRLHPPILTMTRSDPKGGDIFTTPVNSGQLGPMITNGRGQLVWYNHTGRDTSFNFERQDYRGHPVLTWWQGRVVHGHGADGQDWIMNSAYHRVAVLHGGYGYSSDLHEFQLIPHGRALIDAYTVVPADLSSVGGPTNGRVLDCIIQELDVRTGKVLWEWHAYGHVPLSASYNWVPGDQTPFDFFHLNSIQQLSGHRLIISARNTWAVYMIDERTGRVIWTLGGKYSNWRMGPGTNFEWQHDARLHRRGILTVFDDAAVPQEESESSAKEMRVDVSTGLVSLVRRFTHSPSLLAGSQGNAELMSNGDMMVGWGAGTGFTEYAPSGRVILDGRYRLGVNSYRSYRFAWTGQPTYRPALAIVPGADGSARLYASWNGATQVASWEVLGGQSRHDLIPLLARANHGFETSIHVQSEPRFFAVRALNRQGHVLGRSYLRFTPSHVAIFGQTAYANTSTRLAGVPVACFAASACSVTMRVTAGKKAIGPAHAARVQAGKIVLIAFRLSPSGVSTLTRAAHRRLTVRVDVRGKGGSGAGRRLTLIPYSTSGPSPTQSVAQDPAVQLVGTTELASAHGRGGILAACYGPAPCQIKAVVSVGHTIVARPGPRYLGIGEAAYLPFRLNAAGRRMLGGARGNQLAARVTLVDGNSVATGRVVLSHYS